MTNHPNRQKTPYHVIHAGRLLARFFKPEDALWWAKRQSAETGHFLEIIAPDGVIGQFRSGLATPEFGGPAAQG